MAKIIKIDVASPANYGEVELNVERVIAVIPRKRWLLFEDVFWKLDEENFNKVYEVWKQL